MRLNGVTLQNGETIAVTMEDIDGLKEFVLAVRCKDCRKYSSAGFCRCHKHFTDGDDFCSRGERKE